MADLECGPSGSTVGQIIDRINENTVNVRGRVWVTLTGYRLGDITSYDGDVYVALSDNDQHRPDLYPAVWRFVG